ncbi:hypothetical protein [Thiomonas sp. X19]|uniref:hypothetical protein n=1 Tax=Thiomonas sp. X19 TaxID=1050370 RepID=UPI0011BD62FD|nr:hypothetical protein [Thiomonas sp. X19]
MPVVLSTVDSIALEFTGVPWSMLSPEKKMGEFIRRNLAEPCSGLCHFHGFCNANMLLHEVSMRSGMDLTD